MKRFLVWALPLLLASGSAPGVLRLAEESYLSQGLSGGYMVILDSDHDGSAELLIRTYFRDVRRGGLGFYEWVNPDSFALVYTDTGTATPQGVVTGNLQPFAAGYLDADNLVDLVGTNGDCYPDSFFLLICQHEAHSQNAYPDTLVWWVRYGKNCAQSEQVYLQDLDQDGKQDILMFSGPAGRVEVYENVSNNHTHLVATPLYGHDATGSFAIGDFDQDGRTEFATAGTSWLNTVFIWECTGDNQYQYVAEKYIDWPNGHDVFEGHDVDQNGKPEFFVGFARYNGNWPMYLYQFEATGNNQYDTTFVDSAKCWSSDWSRWSKCGDLDGDGVDELVWSVGTDIRVYKGVAPHRFELQQAWWNHGSNCADLNIYDINQDGYNEIVTSGSNVTWVLGLEAVKVKYPNGGQTFRGNDTVLIRWQKFEPPRCDSTSLFFSMDNGLTYDTIATGLSPADTSFPWVVPDVRSDSCLVKAVVYGPGWRQDESDSVFRVLPSGIAEERSRPKQSFGLVVCPNPMTGETFLSFGPWRKDGSSLCVFDASGRLVCDLTGEVAEGGCVRWARTDASGRRVAQGIYLVQFRSAGRSLTRKVVVR